jgi:putative hydrolase of the HAD superfamily
MNRAIFFDAAGTLFEPREPIGVSYARIAEHFGVHADPAAVASGFRRAFASAPGLSFGPGHSTSELRRLEYRWWHGLVAQVFAGLGKFDDFDAYFDALFAFFADPANWCADPEAPQVLDDLRQRGFALGVVSNFDYRLYGILNGLALTAHFDSITLSSEAGFAKPAPEIFNAALRKHAVEPAAAIHVGDSEPLDVKGAAAAGIAAVLLDRDGRGSVTIRGRTATIGSLASVLRVAQRLRLA